MHGGANEACVRMLREIKTADRIPEFLARAKDKRDPFKLMGFGHRVYRNLDPRAKEMKALALECIAEYERQNPLDDDAYVTASAPVGAAAGASAAPPDAGDLRALFGLAVDLEAAALADEYFASRKLFPNVDFYSGLALTAMKIPLELFTCLFAVGRSVGWIAQWKEAMEDPARKISRPRQLYVGETARSYVAPAARPESPRGVREQRSFTDATYAEDDHTSSFGYFT